MAVEVVGNVTVEVVVGMSAWFGGDVAAGFAVDMTAVAAVCMVAD